MFNVNDKIKNAVDKPGFNVKFRKYEFTQARRKIIGDILGINFGRVPSKVVALEGETPEQALVNNMVKQYHITEDQQAKIKASVIKGMDRVVTTDMDFTINFLSTVNWEPGTFGAGFNGEKGLDESKSCFFTGGKSGAFNMISNAGGYPVTVYSNGVHPYARFFIVPYMDDGYVTFNIYLKDQAVFGVSVDDILGIFTGAIAKWLGAEYKYGRIKLDNNGTTTGTLWINNSGTAQVITKGHLVNGVSLKIKEERGIKCTRCDMPLLQPNQIVYDGNGTPWCEECAEDGLEACAYDAKLYNKMQFADGPDGKRYFRDNIAKIDKFVYCQETQKYILKVNARKLSNGMWVKKDSKFEACKGCGRIGPVSAKGLCQDCVPEQDMIDMLNSLDVDIFDMKWDFPQDEAKAEKFIKDIYEKLNALN